MAFWSSGFWATGFWADGFWSEDDTPAPPVVTEPTPAGRSKRRRYYVEIDGQPFEVSSTQEAQYILDRAKALAERAAEEAAKKVEAKVSRVAKPKPIRLEKPRVRISPELAIDTAPFIRDIGRIYDNAAALAELRVLLARAADEDEEESILLLM
jgi:hypothetical protein